MLFFLSCPFNHLSLLATVNWKAKSSLAVSYFKTVGLGLIALAYLLCKVEMVCKAHFLEFGNCFLKRFKSQTAHPNSIKTVYFETVFKSVFEIG